MSDQLGVESRPLRVAIIGSGPSGFYAAGALFSREDLHVTVDMFDKLPTPFGLVRYGVAPDHHKIKGVVKVYEKIATDERFNFFGNVCVGKDIEVNEMKRFYDAIIIATGAETDRKLGILGENLIGSHTATEFVAWYNGHPDFQGRQFDLSKEVAVIVGQGNVAMDVSRILCKTPDELKKTDITQNALDALAQSKIKEVHMIGRRGPAQAAFTPPELKEMGELSDCMPIIKPSDLDLNEASLAELQEPTNKQKLKNFEIMKEFSQLSVGSKPKRFFMHFFRSPSQIVGSEYVEKVLFDCNELVGDAGAQKSRATGSLEVLDCGIFFRSVGYRGLPIPGLPFDDRAGIIPHQEGRVTDAEHIFTGLYVTGWIKRGPRGVIGTNKADSEETVKELLADLPSLPGCATPYTEGVINLLHDRGVRIVTYDDWKTLDQIEIQEGEKKGKPREKFTNIEQMINSLPKHSEPVEK